jgi:hypothetical protein
MADSRFAPWFAVSVQQPGEALKQGDHLFVVEHAWRDEKWAR